MAVRFIESYVHTNRIGVLVELEAADDFATRTDEFRELARDIAMQVAASDPASDEDDDLKIVASKLGRNILPQAVEKTLMSQPFIKNQDLTVADRIKEIDLQLHANIKVIRYVRFEAGAA